MTDLSAVCRPLTDAGCFDFQSPRGGGCQTDLKESSKVHWQEAEEVDGPYFVCIVKLLHSNGCQQDIICALALRYVVPTHSLPLLSDRFLCCFQFIPYSWD